MDYTAIDIATDPKTQRMFGITAHGGLDFDVPYMSNIEGNLWMGGCENGLRLPEEIQHLISLYPWEAYRVHPGIRTMASVVMYDDEDAPILSSQIERIVDWVVACLDEGPTLVHCQAGLNRSGLICAKVLIRLGRTPEEAVRLLRERRSPAVLCNRKFEAYVLGQRI